MSYIFAIVSLPLTKLTTQTSYAEYTHATVIFQNSKAITSEVIKYTFPDLTRALEYGAILLSIPEIPLFASKIKNLPIKTRFVVYVQDPNNDPKSWNLPAYFHELHFSHQDTTITRASIVDADQAYADYPHFRTAAGHAAAVAYIAMYEVYYLEKNKSELPLIHTNTQANVKHEHNLPTAPSSYELVDRSPPSYDQTRRNHERDHVQQKPSSSNSNVKKMSVLSNPNTLYPVVNQSLQLQESHFTHTPESGSIESLHTMTTNHHSYVPTIYSFPSTSNKRTFWSYFCCSKNYDEEVIGRMRLERYQDRLNNYLSRRNHTEKVQSLLEILQSGSCPKNLHDSRILIPKDDIKQNCSISEMVAFISSKWNCDPIVLNELVYHTSLFNDLMFGKLISVELLKIIKMMKTKMSSNNFLLYIGRRSNHKCLKDDASNYREWHCHSTLLDSLFDLDKGDSLRRILLLSFELINVKLNIQHDAEYLTLQIPV